ncbi:MAG: lysophospholipid acyltransferase family protein [Pleurocapsa sp.]
MTQLKPSITEDNSKSNQSPDIDSRISPWLARMLYPLGCYVIIPLFFGKIEVTGRENIPQQDSVIVAPTHRSRWDAFLVPYAVGKMVSGRDLRFMVSANEVKGVQGWFVRRMGGFPVDTDNPKIGSVRHSIELLREDDEMLVIFPEGGIYRENFIHPLKRGVALIALEAETAKCDRRAKILPLSIRYSQPIPSWGTDVKIDIGKPLTVADYLSNSLRKSSRELTTDLQTSLEKLYGN